MKRKAMSLSEAGKLGGKARSERLTAEQRQAIAKKGGLARVAKDRAAHGH
jgi:hypothetical protein